MLGPGMFISCVYYIYIYIYICICLCVIYLLFGDLSGRGKSVDTSTQENLTHPHSHFYFDDSSYLTHRHDYLRNFDLVLVWMFPAVRSHGVKIAHLPPIDIGQRFQENLEKLLRRFVPRGLSR